MIASILTSHSPVRYQFRHVMFEVLFRLFSGSSMRGSHLVMIRGHYLLFTQESPLAVLVVPYGMLRIEPRSGTHKAVPTHCTITPPPVQPT